MNITNDWKKHAATQFKDEEMEKAFMDQAYSFIQNKAGRLLSDPHRLGFEIVFKNDAATRLVGVFAFRNDKELLYAPCFFINGQIKGADLLYQQAKKKFIPLSEAWVDYILDASQAKQGIPYDGANQLHRSMDVNKLVIPPSGRGWGEKAGSAQDIWTEMQKSAEFKPILRQFMLEDGGMEALNAIDKMARASMEFAEGLSKLDMEDWAPEGLKSLHTKEASTSEPGKLELVTQIWHSKEASVQEGITKRGYDLIDKRHDLNPVMSHDMEIQSVGQSGVYEVLTSDGELQKATCIVSNDTGYSSPYSLGGGSDWTDVYAIFENGSVTKCTCRCPGEEVLGKCVTENFEDWVSETDAKDKPTTGGVWGCYSPDKACFVTGKATKVSERNGILRVTLESPWGGEKEIIVNPDLEACEKNYDGMSCPKAHWFKLKSSTNKDEPYAKGPNLASDGALDTFIKSVGYVPAEIITSEKSAGQRFELKMNGRTSEDLTKLAMTIKIARDLKVPGQDAIQLIDEAEKKGSCKFWMEKEQMEKAGAFQLIEAPDFYNQMDSEFNLPVDYGHEQALEVDSDTEYFPGRRIGDAEEPQGAAEGMSEEEIFEQTPEQIAQLAQMRELPKVFEHGLVGAMVNTQDASGLVSKYSVELLDAVDALARILFIFYWKPGEMQDAYGLDDMHHMEDQLLSTFKILGDLTLELLKKNTMSDAAQQVSPA